MNGFIPYLENAVDNIENPALAPAPAPTPTPTRSNTPTKPHKNYWDDPPKSPPPPTQLYE
jgi:hypothetical protein